MAEKQVLYIPVPGTRGEELMLLNLGIVKSVIMVGLWKKDNCFVMEKKDNCFVMELAPKADMASLLLFMVR